MTQLVWKMLRYLLMAFIVFSSATMLLIGVAALMMWMNGNLEKDHVDRAVLALRGVEPEVVRIPPGVPEEEWKKIQDARERQEGNNALQKQELIGLRNFIEARREQLKSEREALLEQEEELEKEREIFSKKKEAWAQQQRDAVFQDNVKKFSETAPKILVKLWENLSNDEIVRYLRAMESDVVASVLKEFQKSQAYTQIPLDEDGRPAGAPRLTQIVQLMEKA